MRTRYRPNRIYKLTCNTTNDTVQLFTEYGQRVPIVQFAPSRAEARAHLPRERALRTRELRTVNELCKDDARWCPDCGQWQCYVQPNAAGTPRGPKKRDSGHAFTSPPGAGAGNAGSLQGTHHRPRWHKLLQYHLHRQIGHQQRWVQLPNFRKQSSFLRPYWNAG